MISRIIKYKDNFYVEKASNTLDYYDKNYPLSTIDSWYKAGAHVRLRCGMTKEELLEFLKRNKIYVK